MLATGPLAAIARTLALIALIGSAHACAGDGAVDIELLWPEDPSLSPSPGEVFEITLVRDAPGEGTTRTVHQIVAPDGAVALGRVAAGEQLRLAVELRSANQRLVGYGRSPDPLDIAPGDSLTVPMHVRRPFVYQSGASELEAFDATRDVTDASYRTRLTGVLAPQVTATSSDGRALYSVTDGAGGVQLSVLATTDHASAMNESVSLPAAATDLAVSADGTRVVVGHQQPGGVSVIDMTATGASSVTTLDVGGPVGRVAIGGDAGPAADPAAGTGTAYALIARSDDCAGAGPSQVVAIDLAGPGAVGDTLTLSAPAQDIAASPRGPQVFVANGCDDVVLGAVLGDAPGTVELARVPGVSTVAVLGDRVWAVGSLAPDVSTGARLVAVSMDTAGGEQTSVEMPVLQERAKTLEFSGTGDESVRQMDADRVTALHLGVLPGGDGLAIVIESHFHAPASGEFIDILGFPLPILPELQIDSHEYLLVDTATATVVQRVRSQCLLEQLSIEALVTDWECTQTPGQDVSADSYRPTGLSVLYGAN